MRRFAPQPIGEQNRNGNWRRYDLRRIVGAGAFASQSLAITLRPSDFQHHHRRMNFLLLIRISLLCLLSLPAMAETLKGRIVGVSDGDTVTLLDAQHQQHKIRLAGIDAPEKNQAFGHRSKEYLSHLVFDQLVVVDTAKSDRYGRQVGTIRVNGKDANLEQVRAGMAWHYKQYQNEQSPADRALYSEAEEQARQQRIGLWADDSAPIPPWEFRRRDTKIPNSGTFSQTTCSCASGMLCTGAKGGHYCVMANGRKQYQ